MLQCRYRVYRTPAAYKLAFLSVTLRFLLFDYCPSETLLVNEQ